MLRIAAVAVLGTAAALLLKQRAGAMVLPLAAAVCAFAFFAAAGALEPLLDLTGRAERLSGLGREYYLPVLKCVAIGIVAKAAADLCRDGGQTAMAGAVEFGGAAAALFASLPLLQSLLGLLEGLL